MAYRFKLNETFEEGCRRIGREQLERARRHLKKTPDQAVAVHETRKVLKRVRALVRLVRPVIGEAVFEAENADLRDISWILSTARDRHVLAETLAKLRAASSIDSKAADSLLGGIFDGSNGHAPAAIEPAAKKQALDRLSAAKDRFKTLEVEGEGFEAVGPGLEASYRKARRGFKKAYAEGTDDAFHEWRKGVQYHWRHTLLLASAWPQFCAARGSEARDLSKLLGDDHDLAMLIAFVRADPAQRISAEQAELVDELARKRQKELRASAYPAGMRLFAIGAKELHRTMARYWEAAQTPEMPEPRKQKRSSERIVRLEEPREMTKTPAKRSHSTRDAAGMQRARMARS